MKIPSPFAFFGGLVIVAGTIASVAGAALIITALAAVSTIVFLGVGGLLLARLAYLFVAGWVAGALCEIRRLRR